MSIFKKDAEQYQELAKQERAKAAHLRNHADRLDSVRSEHSPSKKDSDKLESEQKKCLKQAEVHEKKAEQYEDKAKKARENIPERSRNR